MGRNPKLRIRLSKVQDNASKVVDLCMGSKIEVGGVAKGVCGNAALQGRWWMVDVPFWQIVEYKTS